VEAKRSERTRGTKKKFPRVGTEQSVNVLQKRGKVYRFAFHIIRVKYVFADCTRITNFFLLMRYFNTLGTRFSGRGDKGINTMVFTKGGYTRSFVVPNQPNTESQGFVKAIFAAISAAWAGLTLVAMQAWDTAAASGNWPIQDSLSGSPRNPRSGKALFQQLNGNIVNVSGTLASIIEEVPTKEPGGTTTITTVNFSNDAGDLVAEMVYSGALATNENFVLEATPVLPTGTSKLRVSALRRIGVSTAVSPIDLAPIYGGQFPAVPAVGDKLGYRVKIVNDVTGESRIAAEGLTVVAAA
jgi:hypothetical protein